MLKNKVEQEVAAVQSEVQGATRKRARKAKTETKTEVIVAADWSCGGKQVLIEGKGWVSATSDQWAKAVEQGLYK